MNRYRVRVMIDGQVKVLLVRGDNEKRAVNYAQRLCFNKWGVSATEFHNGKLSVEMRE